MGTRGPKPGSGGRPKKAIADKIADGNAGHRPLTVIDFGDSAADLEGQAMPKPTEFLSAKQKDEDGNLVINPEEAEVVKRIYREFMEGKSYYDIGKGLTADGIKTAAGSDYWLASTLRKILTNEKYIGDALLQKTVTTDFLTKKRVVNKGIVPQYYVENSHEAIIPRDIFMQVREEMTRRANISTGTGKRRVYSGQYALSSILFCAHCGDLFRRITWTNRNKKGIVWRCVSRVSKKTSGIDCPARTVREKDLQEVVIKAINDVFSGRDTIIPILKENIEKVIGSGNNSRIEAIEAELAELQKELLKKSQCEAGLR